MADRDVPSKLAVLVVDDDPAVADMLRDVLREQGFDVDCVGDGNAVVPQLIKRSYQLLLLDVLLPHVSGFALMEKIRAMPAFHALPVIMMSGIYRSRNHRSHNMNAHRVIEYLDKPVSTERLLALVRQHVQGAAPAPTPLPLAHTPTESSQISQEFTDLRARHDKAPQATYASLADSEANHERRQVENDARSQFRPSAFLLQGSLKAHPVAPLLGKLWRARASGALLLRQAQMKKILYLRHGSPYSVKSNLISECLGQILVQERIIGRDECETSIILMRDSGKRQGEVLIDMGSITPKNLEFGLEQQVETKLFSTFAWDHGEYRFNPSAPLPPTTVPLRWQCPALIVEGIRRSLDETSLRNLMVPVLDVPVQLRAEGAVVGAPTAGANSRLEELGLEKDEVAALRAVPLPQTIRVLLETMGLHPAMALRVLYSLIALEALVPAASS